MPSSFPFSQSVVNIIATGKFMPVYAVQLDFVDGMVFPHTGTGQLVIGGVTYDGVGNFGEVSQSQESDNSGSPMSVGLTLSGLDAYILSETNVRGCRGRLAKVIFVRVRRERQLRGGHPVLWANGCGQVQLRRQWRER